MKRATSYVFLILILVSFSVLLIIDFPSLFAPPRSEKEIILRSEYNDVSTDMTMDNQGNVIVVGCRMVDADTSTAKFHIVKVSASGDVVWTKTWNNSLSNMLLSVEVDSLDNIVVAGVEGFNEENTTGLVMKLSPNGTIEWEVEYLGFDFEWYSWFQLRHFFGIKIDSTNDTIYAVGSLRNGGHRTLIVNLDSSGSELWRTEWEGPLGSNGTGAATFWISSQHGLVVQCNLYGGDDPFFPYIGSCIASFALNGTLMWNQTVQDYCWTGIEIDSAEYVTAPESWRGYNQVARFNYDFEEISRFELLVGEYYSISIDGFGINGTGNIIGYGTVISLIAGESVERSFSALFSGPQPPQTLVFSFSSSGELHWYDFLVLGRISEPCGVRFDSDNRLIIAGHTSEWASDENDFYVVFGFKQTPVPLPYHNLLFVFFPLFNVLIAGLLTELESLSVERESILGFRTPRWNSKSAIKRLLLVQTILFLLAFNFLIGFGIGGGGPPAPIVYMPKWVLPLLASWFFGIVTLGILYLRITMRVTDKEIMLDH